MQIGNGVSLRGLHLEEFAFTFVVTGTVSQSDIGKAVTLDTTQANSVKLAGDGDPILGRLASYEDRKQEGIKVGTVELKGSYQFTCSGTQPSIGDTLVGAGAGIVKKAPTSLAPAEGATVQPSKPNRTLVVEVLSATEVVVLIH